MNVLTRNAIVNMIEALERKCKCGKTTMRWFHFEYSHDMMGFIKGEDCWTWCCSVEEEE